MHRPLHEMRPDSVRLVSRSEMEKPVINRRALRAGLGFAAVVWALMIPGTVVLVAQAPVPHRQLERAPATGAPATDQYHGGVGCQDGVPVIEPTSERITDSLLRAETVRHEAMHFVQLATGDCEMTLVHWGMSPRVWLEAEAEAFCAGVAFLAGVGDGRTLKAKRIEEYTNLMRFRRPPGLSGEMISAALARWCAE